VATGSSDGVDCTSSIAIEGLKEGEYVKIFWCVEWKREGKPDESKGNSMDALILFTPVVNRVSGHVRYATKLRKADAGWTACLRLRYATNSKTAKIVRREFRGWKVV
jgi:hypothetical protein